MYYTFVVVAGCGVSYDKLIAARQRSVILLQCYLIYETAEDSHSVFGN